VLLVNMYHEEMLFVINQKAVRVRRVRCMTLEAVRRAAFPMKSCRRPGACSDQEDANAVGQRNVFH